MSVCFRVFDSVWNIRWLAGRPRRAEGAESDYAELNVANSNAAELLLALNLPRKLDGMIAAQELEERCLSLLAGLNRSPARDGGRPATRDGRCIDLGRPPGRMRHYANELLLLCEQAGSEGLIVWG